MRREKTDLNNVLALLWEIGYFALFVVFICLFATHKADINVSSVCAAGILGHTVMLTYACMMAVEIVRPFCNFFEKHRPKGVDGLNYILVVLVIEILLIAVEIIWCFALKTKGMFLPKYFLVSPAMAVADLALCWISGNAYRLFEKI